MAIEIDSNSPAFFRSRQFGCCRQPKVKTMVWSILNETQLDYCSYSSYESNHMLWAPAVNDGCRFGHLFQRWVSNLLKTQVAVELNKLLCNFIKLNKTQRNHPWPTPLDGRLCIKLGRLIKPTLQGGKRLTIVVMFVVEFC